MSDNKRNGKNIKNGDNADKRPNGGQSGGKKRKYDDFVFVEEQEFEDVYSNSSDAEKIDVFQKSKSVRKSKKKKKHILFKLIALLLLVLVAAGAAGVYSVISLLDGIEYETGEKHINSYIQQSDLASSDDVKNILLIGVDSRSEKADTRSDTMMLVSVNAVKKEIVLTSFMRDLYVEIPRNGHNRLNSANVFGGPELLTDTIEKNFKIDIDSYMLVTFDVFRKLIDGVGGVYVDITEDEARYMHGSYVNLPNIKSGENIHLNGKEALWYCRIRKLDSDFHRTDRQREVVKSIIAQVVKTSPAKLYGTAREMMSLIKTDLTKDEILSLASFAPALYTGYEIKSVTIPADDTWRYASRRGMSVIVADENKNAEYLKAEIYG